MTSAVRERSLAYPSWHPVIHHSLVLFFIVMVVLLPVLYIRTRNVPYWVIPLVLSCCAVVYLIYWVWVCVYCRHVNDVEADQRVTIATNASITTSGQNSSTVGIPPRSFTINQRNPSHSPATTAVMYLHPHHSASVRSYSTEYNVDAAPPPAYHTSFEHAVVDFSMHPPSPPSYHSVKDEEDSNNIFAAEQTYLSRNR